MLKAVAWQQWSMNFDSPHTEFLPKKRKTLENHVATKKKMSIKFIIHRNIFADNWVNLKTFPFIRSNVAYNKIIHAQFLKNQIQCMVSTQFYSINFVVKTSRGVENSVWVLCSDLTIEWSTKKVYKIPWFERNVGCCDC